MMNAQPKTAAWQLQEAKAKFSEVVKRTSVEPQLITVRGEGVAIMLSLETYQKLVKPKPNLYEFMQNSPLRGAEADTIFDFMEKDKQFFGERDINL
jgi:prevent-host-death family protein